MRSPGCRWWYCDRCAMTAARSWNQLSDRSDDCGCSPLTRSSIRARSGWPISAAGAMSPSTADCSTSLPMSHGRCFSFARRLQVAARSCRGRRRSQRHARAPVPRHHAKRLGCRSRRRAPSRSDSSSCPADTAPSIPMARTCCDCLGEVKRRFADRRDAHLLGVRLVVASDAEDTADRESRSARPRIGAAIGAGGGEYEIAHRLSSLVLVELCHARALHAEMIDALELAVDRSTSATGCRPRRSSKIS